MRKSKVIFVILAIFFIFCFSVDASNKRIDRGGVGFKAGIIYYSTFNLDTVDVESNIGLSAGVFFDINLYKKLQFSVETNLHDIQILNKRPKMINLNLGLKTSFYKPHYGIAWRPGVMVGFAQLAEVWIIPASTYLILKGYVDLLVMRNRNHSWVFELGVFGSPKGGARGYDITFGPIWTFRAGVMY